MALYHFSVKQVSRGKGQTVVNSAAYISGQKLYNDYYGQTHDYTKKSPGINIKERRIKKSM